MEAAPLLEANHATREFATRGGRQRGTIAAVDDVTLALPQSPTLISLVGESGSGKTTLSRMVLGLERQTQSEIRDQGKKIFALSPADWKSYRRVGQAAFSDPAAMLNASHQAEPVLQVVLQH